MTKQDFIKSRKFVKMDNEGYTYLKNNAPHILDEYNYEDIEWKDSVIGVYLYDEFYYIFAHRDNLYSTIVNRINYIYDDISLVEEPLWDYIEFDYNTYSESNKVSELINEGKNDIKEFIQNNSELEINNFEDLHNYYDANCYVETLIDDKGIFMISESNKVIDELDKYIKEFNK